VVLARGLDLVVSRQVREALGQLGGPEHGGPVALGGDATGDDAHGLVAHHDGAAGVAGIDRCLGGEAVDHVGVALLVLHRGVAVDDATHGDVPVGLVPADVTGGLARRAAGVEDLAADVVRRHVVHTGDRSGV